MRLSAPCAACMIVAAGCAATPVQDPLANRPPKDGPGTLEGFEEGKSYWIPAAEILVFEGLLNLYDRSLDERTYGSDSESIEDNLESGWVIDQDPFSTNQLGHPYAGSMYHAFARSAGLDYWVSMGYTFAGSAVWEVAGEVTKPSLNDQITTSFGGSFLGEAFFRTASWILERGGTRPGTAREIGAALVSPPNTINRRFFGKRFKQLYPSRSAAVSSRAEFGAERTRASDLRSTADDWSTDGTVQFAVDYGMPGRRDYEYDEPFDYFHLGLGASTDPDNRVDHLLVHGLLVGEGYSSGPDFDGVWGLFGGYSYLSPGPYRLASTALSIGTAVQDRVAEALTVQGSLLAGLGFGSGGTIADDESDRDYHYGLTPQAILDLRCIFGDVVMLQLAGQDYSVGGAGYNENGGRENVLRLEASLTVRVYGPHALRIQCVGDWRDAEYDSAPDQEQSAASVAVVYSFLGGTRLEAIR